MLGVLIILLLQALARNNTLWMTWRLDKTTYIGKTTPDETTPDDLHHNHTAETTQYRQLEASPTTDFLAAAVTTTVSAYQCHNMRRQLEVTPSTSP